MSVTHESPAIHDDDDRASRHAYVLAMRREGLPFLEIGARAGYTNERARQICERAMRLCRRHPLFREVKQVWPEVMRFDTAAIRRGRKWHRHWNLTFLQFVTLGAGDVTVEFTYTSGAADTRTAIHAVVERAQDAEAQCRKGAENANA